jgi:hypothetical protein
LYPDSHPGTLAFWEPRRSGLTATFAPFGITTTPTRRRVGDPGAQPCRWDLAPVELVGLGTCRGLSRCPPGYHRAMAKPRKRDAWCRTPSGEPLDRPPKEKWRRLLAHVEEWTKDDTGYDERAWPEILRSLNADRMSHRSRS